MRQKPKGPGKVPSLCSSLPSTIGLHHAVHYILSTLFLTLLCTARPFLLGIRSLASSSSVHVVTVGFLAILVELLVYVCFLAHVHNPCLGRRLALLATGSKGRYRRYHISHMRKDRLQRLWLSMRKDPFSFADWGTPSPPSSGSGDGRPRSFHRSDRNHWRFGVMLGGGQFPPPSCEEPCAWLDRIALNDAAPPEAPDLVDACREALLELAGRPTMPPSVPPHKLSFARLASLLSNAWLSDELINAGVEYILHHASGSHPNVCGLDTLHVRCLQVASERFPEYKANSPVDLGIQSKQFTSLFLPMHVNDNHWTLLHLDLAASTYSYADCLYGHCNPPERQFNLIRWWLRGLGADQVEWRHTPFKFHLPTQRDSHSCGVIVLSLMATSLLNVDMWAPNRACVERMNWFLRLCPNLDEEDDDKGMDIEDGSPDSGASSNGASARPSSFPTRAPLASPSPDDGNSNDDADMGEVRDLAEGYLTERQKRSPSPDDGDSSDDPDIGEVPDAAEGCLTKRRKLNSGGPVDPSWAKQKALKVRLKSDPDFKGNRKRLQAWKARIRKADPHAEFSDADPCTVRCSSCCSWVQMRVLYDIRRFTEHRASARCMSRQANGLATPSLFALGFTIKKTEEETVQDLPIMVPLPCPGLTSDADVRVATYLSRVTVSTGGAPARMTIARSLFELDDDTTWTGLSQLQQKMVLRREEVLAAWRVSHGLDAVYSTSCLETIHAPVDKVPPPCEQCLSLFDLHTFQVAIRRPAPLESNMKFVPKRYRCQKLGKIYLKYHGVRQLMEMNEQDKRSPWLKFAKGVAAGEYQSDAMLGMVQAMVVKHQRLENGKSLRNMSYSGAFSDFCDILSALSPVAYRTFQHQFGGRTVDGIRKLRAKRGKFQPGFSPLNIAAAAKTLADYDYHGPLALSWDDTELEPAISIFQESRDVCLVIGAAQGVIRVDTGDDLDKVFEQAQLDQATKLRLWLLTIPLPKIPPIVIAAVARGNKDTAEDLEAMHNKVAALLHERDIHPVSGASDGTETERALQRLIVHSADDRKLYTIANTKCPSAIITLTIPLVFSKHPFIAVQDSKHALKTARNQILTGARLLVIGNDILHIDQLHTSAVSGASPLLARDIENLDRQDDRAAARTFSAAMLEFQMKKEPSQRALAVYLFVLGELVDAWQNRRISHLERAKMVMRARFFLTAWRSHIVAHPDHSLNIQFISRESFDIFITLCDSLLSLIIVYRKYYPKYPLLPWLHSTESDEHVFGATRKGIPNFTYADMLAAAHKVFALISGAFKNLTSEEKANQTAAGYHHTYFKDEDLDLRVLGQYPTDMELGTASDAAFEETVQLTSVFGIAAQTMIAAHALSTTNSADDDDCDDNGDDPTVPPHQTIASLLSLFDTSWLSPKSNEEYEACKYAFAADKASQSEALHALPDATDEEVQAVRTQVKNSLPEAFPVSQDEPSETECSMTTLTLVSSTKELQVQTMVAERICHQTKETAKAVRQKAGPSLLQGMNSNARFCADGPTLHEELSMKLKALAGEAAVKEKQSSTSGVSRQVRYTGTFAGCSTATQKENAVVAGHLAADNFLRHRDPAFARFRGVHECFYSANISSLLPLLPGHFVIALSGVKDRPQVFLGEVAAMYTKGAGKHGSHKRLAKLENLGAASYIYVRKFASMAFDNLDFTSLDCPSLASPTYLQVPRTHVVFSLASFSRSITTQTIRNLTLATLCPESSTLFTLFQGHRDALYACVKELQRTIKNASSTQ
ncbi:hypothetical protein DFP72DRAFT_1109656 [Ephemerocybe angulata]|uniref:Ubiquitin-like protease family profile domain-containing protein n=1 Tax=Ephemerocybe angulata TaxID=980116 RepID=A0A8H6LVA3_9AGAR|nr:hypothetical protein DFP72DRAFT_1109656 [Tulosesus angulatus]